MTGVCTALAEQVQPVVWPKPQFLTGGVDLYPPRSSTAAGSPGSAPAPAPPPGKGVLAPSKPIRNTNDPTLGPCDAKRSFKKRLLRQQKSPFSPGGGHALGSFRVASPHAPSAPGQQAGTARTHPPHPVSPGTPPELLPPPHSPRTPGG